MKVKNYKRNEKKVEARNVKIKENITLVNQIVKGERVLLCRSTDCEEMKNLYPDKNLVIAPMKYDKHFNLFWVSVGVGKKRGERIIELPVEINCSEFLK